MSLTDHLRDYDDEDIFTAVVSGDPVAPAFAFNDEFTVRLSVVDVPMTNGADATLTVTQGWMATVTPDGVELYVNVPIHSQTKPLPVSAGGGHAYIEFDGVPGYIGSTYTFTTQGADWPVSIVPVRPQQPGVALECEDFAQAVPPTTEPVVPMSCDGCTDEGAEAALPSVEIKDFGCADPCIIYPTMLGVCQWPDVCSDLPAAVKAVCEEGLDPCAEVECPGGPCTDPPAFLEEVCATPKPSVCETVGILAPEAAETMCAIEAPDPLEWCPTLMACLPTDPCAVEVGKESVCGGIDPCVTVEVVKGEVDTCGSVPVDPCADGGDEDGLTLVDACNPPGPDPVVLCDVYGFPILCSGSLPDWCTDAAPALCEELECWGMTVQACLLAQLPPEEPEPEASTMSGGSTCTKALYHDFSSLREVAANWQDRETADSSIVGQNVAYEKGNAELEFSLEQRCGPEFALSGLSTVDLAASWSFTSFNEQNGLFGSAKYPMFWTAMNRASSTTDFDGRIFETVTRPILRVTAMDLSGTDSHGHPFTSADLDEWEVSGIPLVSIPPGCGYYGSNSAAISTLVTALDLALAVADVAWEIGLILSLADMGMTNYCDVKLENYRVLDPDYDHSLGVKTKRAVKAWENEQKTVFGEFEFHAFEDPDATGGTDSPASLRFGYDVYATVDVTHHYYDGSMTGAYRTLTYDIGTSHPSDEDVQTMRIF